MKEIKWIYQSDAEEEEFLQDLENHCSMIFGDLGNPPIPLESMQEGYIFDLRGIGFYYLSKEDFLQLKAIWKESLLIRNYKSESDQYLIG